MNSSRIDLTVDRIDRMSSSQLSPYFTANELAARLRRSRRTIKRMVEARKFAGVVQVGRQYLIPIESVQDYEARHTLPGPRVQR